MGKIFGHRACKSVVEVVAKATFDAHSHGKITRAGKISGVAAEMLVSTDASGNVQAKNELNADVKFNSIELSREMATIYTVSVPVSGWSTSAPYTQSVAVPGLTANDTPIIDLDMSEATEETATDLGDAFVKIGRAVTGNGTLTLYCYTEAPTVDISLRIKATR